MMLSFLPPAPKSCGYFVALALAMFLGAAPLGRAQSIVQTPAARALDALLIKVQPEQSEVVIDDMRFHPATLRAMRDQLAGITAAPAPDAASQASIAFWPGGIVYYNFASNVSALHQQAFLDAAAEWAAWANLTFTLANAGQANYILVNDGGASLSGGNSFVGVKGGPQALNIGSTSWNRGTLCHEIGHALGFIHEHQRSDRDSYVTILTQNTTDGGANFIKLTDSTNKGAYDFYSVMHYARNAFSKNPTPANPNLPDTTSDTIEPLPAYNQFLNVMGREYDRTLSKLDRASIAQIYGAPAVAPGLIVTNTKDGGPGSLRTSVYYAFDRSVDAVGSTNSIVFHIPTTAPGYSGGVFTIGLTSLLTAPGDGTTIDGTTQTAFTGNTNLNGPEIALNGAGVLASEFLYASGVRLRAANCSVKGLDIENFNTQGIEIVGAAATGNIVQGCYIGTNAAGTAAAPNAFAGIEIYGGAQGNLIGGGSASARNVISGNAAQGIYLHDAGTVNNTVQGNYIGTNSTGTTALANAFSGIEIGLSAQNNLIGGPAAGAGNLISGNTYQGIYLNGVGTQGNTMQGNYIGTDASGASALGNGFADRANHIFAPGIQIYNGPSANTIGGTSAAARNVISGNAAQGVSISGPISNGNILAGNYIGINAAGTAALANGAADPANFYNYSGVAIYGGAVSNIIGGIATGAGNVISGNAAQGVILSDAGTSGNLLAGNLIGLNPAGAAAIGNGYAGVSIFGAASSNIVGGTTASARNVISGNGNQGVTISDANTSSNIVEGNYLGLDVSGLSKVANTYGGVEIFGGATSNLVGGTAPGARNFLSGNNAYGVAFSGSGTNANLAQGNTIGLNVAGAAVSNGYQGVAIFGGAQNNQIGGTVAGAGNLISGNTASGGVAFFDAASINNSLHENAIYGNGGAELALYNGANGSPSTPTVSQAVLGLNTSLTGSLNGVSANTSYLLEFFATPSGATGGKVYVGSFNVTSNGSGTASFAQSLASKVPAGSQILATATSPTGNTSAFSAARFVTAVDSDGDGIPDVYENAHGLNAASAADASLDSDGDGLTNLQEYRAGTDPRDAKSRFQITSVTQGSSGTNLSFSSVANQLYRLESTTDLTIQNPWRLLTDSIVGSGSSVQLTLPATAGEPKRFYRIVVEP